MKNLENAKELNELEVEKVAGGVPILHPFFDYDPYVKPEVEVPEIAVPAPTGRQASQEEEQQAVFNLY